jgi:hypothetical protein
MLYKGDIRPAGVGENGHFLFIMSVKGLSTGTPVSLGWPALLGL